MWERRFYFGCVLKISLIGFFKRGSKVYIKYIVKVFGLRFWNDELLFFEVGKVEREVGLG